MTMPCSNNPDEVIEKVVSAKDNADKFDRFVNGTDIETVQLGTGSPTPVIRNAVRQMVADASWAKQHIADAPEGDVSLNNVTAMLSIYPRTLAERFSDELTPLDFGAKGDGTTDDSAAFLALESAVQDKYVNCLGRTYVVDSIKTGCRYCNGTFNVDGVDYPVEYSFARAGVFGVAIGENAGQSVVKTRTVADLTAIGKNAAQNLTVGRNSIAIGHNALQNIVGGRYNIAIGSWSLSHLETADGTGRTPEATRNIGIGGNTGHFMTTGYGNIMLGRDCAHAITTGYRNIVIGAGAMMGDCPSYLHDDGRVILQTPLTGFENIVVGDHAGYYCQGNKNVFIGTQAMFNMKKTDEMVAIGFRAGYKIDYNVSPFGTNQTNVDISGIYSQSGNVITIQTASAHGASVGDKVWLRFLDGTLGDLSANDDIWFDVATVPNSTSFTIASEFSRSASGTIKLSRVADSTSISVKTEECTLVGRLAAWDATSLQHTTAVGARAGMKGGDYAVYIGAQAGSNATGKENTLVGWRSGTQLTTGEDNTAIGLMTLLNATTGKFNTAVGCSALRYNIDGTNFNSNYCVGLGFNAKCSGDNQVQLGGSGTTTYAYGSIQDRSDARDKADIRDTQLGLDFVLSLHPVDFKWDYRDDYIETVEHNIKVKDKDGNEHIERVSEVIKHEKDGSRKRNRYHHGLIAQEVKSVLDEKCIDFGGYQDHKINGGKDVLSLGYEEFIGPIIKSIQELYTRLTALEG